MIYVIMIYLLVAIPFFYLGFKHKTILEVSNTRLVYKTLLWPIGVLLMSLALLETFFYWLSEICNTTYNKIQDLLGSFEPKKLPTWLDNYLNKYRS